MHKAVTLLGLGSNLFAAFALLGCAEPLDSPEAPEFDTMQYGRTASDFFDDWKLQIQDGGGSYDEYKSAPSSTGGRFSWSSGWTSFTFRISDSQEDFSSRSKPRVELREMNNGDKAAWSQEDNHELRAWIRVRDEELNGYTRNIIIMQAHTTDDEGSDPFDGKKSDSFGAAVVWDVKDDRLECKIRGQDGDDDYDSILDSPRLSNWYRLRIQVKDGRARCSRRNSNNTSWVNTSWRDLIGGRAYFKTGNYTQPRVERVSDSVGRTKVEVKSIYLSH